MATKGQRFPSKWMKAEEIPAGGVLLTIKQLAEEFVADDPEAKLVCYFTNHAKGLILNKTNWDRIATYHGPDDDQWPGKKIALVIEKVQYKKELVDAIRVVPKAPVVAPVEPPTEEPLFAGA